MIRSPYSQPARLRSAAITLIIAVAIDIFNWGWFICGVFNHSGRSVISFIFDTSTGYMVLLQIFLKLLLLATGILLLPRVSDGFIPADRVRRRTVFPMIAYAAIMFFFSGWGLIDRTQQSGDAVPVLVLIYNARWVLYELVILFFALSLLSSGRRWRCVACTALAVASCIMIAFQIYFNYSNYGNMDGDVLNMLRSSLTFFPVAWLLLSGVFRMDKKDSPDGTRTAGQTDRTGYRPAAVPPAPRREAPSPTRPGAGSGGFRLPAGAVHPDWFLSEGAQKNMIKPVKATWNVDCSVYTLSDSDRAAIESQHPKDTACKTVGGEGIPYMLEISSNAIFTHEYGAFLDFGYVKFMYRDRIYYVNVAPMVKLTHDLYNRDSLLCHMAKIMIVLMPEIKDRKNVLVTLDGDLKQN
jgi:hypothetical protein